LFTALLQVLLFSNAMGINSRVNPADRDHDEEKIHHQAVRWGGGLSSRAAKAAKKGR
jgi:hypothetical protein